MPRQKKRPAYSLHRPTGQARVRIDGHDYYLGEYGSPESRDRYDELVQEWLTRQDISRVTVTIDDLALLYLEFARGYYSLDGKPTREFENIQTALRLLVAFSGRKRAQAFGPRLFGQFRDSLVGRKSARPAGRAGRPISRQYINKLLRYVVRCFKWASAEEYVSVAVWQALTSVPGLKRGRTLARTDCPPDPRSGPMPVCDSCKSAGRAHRFFLSFMNRVPNRLR